MDVKEAIGIAKQYVSDVFSGEHVSDLGLEEVEFDDSSNTWSVTLGFSRPWENVIDPIERFRAQFTNRKRSYKIVRIRDDDKKSSQ